MAAEKIKAFQVRLPLSVYEKLDKQAGESLRSLNAEIIISLREYFEISHILQDPNMRFILSSLADMPGNLGETAITLEQVKNFLNTYAEVVFAMAKNPKKTKK